MAVDEIRRQNQARNHPQKGSEIRVEPIRRLEDIRAIKKMLHSEPRNLLMFVMGINSGLRIGDLLKLKAGQVRDLEPGHPVLIKEQKTGKPNVLVINKPIYNALNYYFRKLQPADNDYLFKSRKYPDKPMTVSNANLLIKKWTKAINLPGNYGTHTLRKTWGYCQRVHYGVGIDIIQARFNHASQKTTKAYLGIQSQEVNGILLNNEL